MNDKNVVIGRTGGKVEIMAYVFSMGRETFKLQRNKQNSSLWKSSVSVDGELKRGLKSTGEAITFMLSIMMRTLLSINANWNVKGVLMNFIIAVKNYL